MSLILVEIKLDIIIIIIIIIELLLIITYLSIISTLLNTYLVEGVIHSHS